MTGLSLFLSRYLFMGCLIWLFYFIFEKPMDALFTTAIRRGHIPGQDVLDEVNEEEKGKGKIERCFHHFPACVLGWPFVIAITVYSAYCWLTKGDAANQ